MIYDSETGHLIFNFQRSTTLEVLNLRCNLTESDTQIMIGGCNISFQRGENSSINEYSLNHLHIFQKDTKYTFTDHRIAFQIGDKRWKNMEFSFYYLEIEFPNHHRECVLDGNTTRVWEDLNVFKELHYCSSNESTQISKNYVSRASINSETTSWNAQEPTKQKRNDNVLLRYFFASNLADDPRTVSREYELNPSSQLNEEILQCAFDRSYDLLYTRAIVDCCDELTRKAGPWQGNWSGQMPTWNQERLQACARFSARKDQVDPDFYFDPTNSVVYHPILKIRDDSCTKNDKYLSVLHDFQNFISDHIESFEVPF
ncbi:hypothetical protein RF11_00903 [Thelohanellus kitauei]|uniref:Uncharacterized protein n=1 Tax=Thelohanellus kitauei TaxID=669202 RepID=A0A0C2MV71_THEKT|nr:hypothetical protein RF11_00903 [Thelohanellus kitauei]